MGLDSKVRIGRIIHNNEVKELRVPKTNSFEFSYSFIHEHFSSTKAKINNFVKDTSRRESNRNPFNLNSELNSQLEKYLKSIKGKEFLYRQTKIGGHYYPIHQEFDIVLKPIVLYEHPQLEAILKQLNLPSLAVLFDGKGFGLDVHSQKALMETHQFTDLSIGRSSAFHNSITLNDKPYILEVKGADFNGRRIRIEQGLKEKLQECSGGLIKSELYDATHNLTFLMKEGYTSVIPIASYIFPELKQTNGESLGIYVRAVQSSPTLAHFVGYIPELCQLLEFSKEDLAKEIIQSVVRDLTKIWKTGLAYNDYFHEQNTRIFGVSDLSGAQKLIGYPKPQIQEDIEEFTFACQNIYRTIFSKKVPFPTYQQFLNDQNGALKLEEKAMQEKFGNLAQDYLHVKNLIISEINQELGTKIENNSCSKNIAGKVIQNL